MSEKPTPLPAMNWVLDPRREPDDEEMPAPESTDKEGMWRLGWRAGWLAALAEIEKVSDGGAR